MQMSTAVGGKIVMVRKWDADEAVRLIREEKITTAGGVPSMAAEIIAHEKQSGETTLEGLMFGGCPPSLRLPQQAAEKFRDTMV